MIATADRTFHVYAGIGVVALVIASSGGIALSRGGGGPDKADDDLDDVVIIDASLAAKKTAEPTAQPHKEFRAPETVKPTVVSNDDKTPSKPDEDPPPKHDDKQNLDDAFAKIRRPNTDDEPVGKPNEQTIGQFDGSEFGTAAETKGDPYWAAMKNDMEWTYPTILDGAGTPLGCLHVDADGKILEIKLKTRSGNDTLDDSVERALETVQKARNDKPIPVPTKLLDQTEHWVCFSFSI